MENKPVLDWTKEKLKKNMSWLGFEVVFQHNSIRLEGLSSQGDILELKKLDYFSKIKIQDYLNLQKADGALVLKKQTDRNKVDAIGYISYGSLEIQLYTLKPLKKD